MRVTELIAKGVVELSGANGEIKNRLDDTEKRALVEMTQGLVNRSRSLFNLAERSRLATDPSTVVAREPLMAPSRNAQRS